MSRAAILLALGCMWIMTQQQLAAQQREFALAIHGGALGRNDNLTDAERSEREAALHKALTLGRDLLQQGKSSLDTVEQVVRLLEDDPLFNSGRGAVLNSRGEHELDASIMDGSSLNCGAVAGVRTVKNPISLARLVMSQTPHVLLAGDGAETFAGEMGVQRETDAYFRTQERIDEWQKRHQRETQAPGREDPAEHMGTVGCVALDKQGHLAAATSTGGLTYKRYGRIGDSPIIGAGTYANDATCAVSCTGKGEEFIRRAIAFHISAQMQYGRLSLDKAVQNVIDEQLPEASGGVIAVGRDGTVSMRFNTAGMARAAADSAGLFTVVVGK
jgi:L-asparaginase / beta-aspartyl-peptidase